MDNKPTYEIYTLAKGRWIVDARFKGPEKQAAIEEAKRIGQQPGVEQAKVVREILLEDGLTKESTVFKTTLKDGSSNGGSVVSAPPRREAPARSTQETPSRQRRSTAGGRQSKNVSTEPRRSLSPGTKLAFKVLMIGLTSFAFATTSTLLFGHYVVS